MGAVFSFLGGALDKRQSDIDEQKKRMKEREDRIYNTIERMRPMIAQQRAIANDWQERYDEGMRYTKDESLAHMYASNNKLDDKFLANNSYLNRANPRLGSQTTSAMTPPTATPPGDGSVGAAQSQGQQNFQQSQGSPGDLQQQAQQTGTSLSGVGAQTNGAIHGANTPQATPNPNVPQSNTQTGMPNNPLAEMAYKYKPGSNVSMLDIVLGRIPDQAMTNSAFEHIGRDMNQNPAQVQQDYNASMTGDYVFKAPPVNPNAPTTQPRLMTYEAANQAAAAHAQGLKFATAENRSKFQDMYTHGLLYGDQNSINQAMTLAMSDTDVEGMKHKGSGGGGTGLLTQQNINNDMGNAVKAAMGASTQTVYVTQPDGSQTPSINVNLGNEPELNRIAASATGLALDMLKTQTGGDRTKANPADFNKIGAKTAAYMILERLAKIEGDGPGDNTQQSSRKLLHDTYTGIMSGNGLTADDLKDVAHFRSKQVIYEPEEQETIMELDRAKNAGDTPGFARVANKHPETYAKYVQEHTAKTAPIPPPANPGEAAPLFDQNAPPQNWDKFKKNMHIAPNQETPADAEKRRKAAIMQAK